MKNRVATMNSTCSAGASLRQQLADVLEGYLADLERGAAPHQEALVAAHPEFADELRPYLDSLRLLHGATHQMRTARVAPASAAAESPTPGARQIGDYEIVREIGRGGMGIVYEAHQKSLNRQVALKVLPFAAVLDQRQIARFRNEAQAAAQLHHSNIVPVFAVGQESGVYYYAMQYINGQSLAEIIETMKGEVRGLRIEGQPCAMPKAAATSTVDRLSPIVAAETLDVTLAPTLADASIVPRSAILDRHPGDFFRTVARLGKEAAEALQHAHEYGIIHRDVKPSNLLVDESGKLWVTDFGLARMQTDNGVTLTGDVVGTLRYMSPEQAAGQTALVDPRTDVYSLGVTMYELLAQQPAYLGDDRQSLTRQIVGEDPVLLRRINPRVPVDLETIVLSAMAKSRDGRYASAQAMADDLGRFLTGKPTLARRPTLVDRAAKWAQRHRALVALGACAVVLLSMISAVGVALLAREQARTSTALTEANESAHTARQNFERAERHFQQARDAVDQFGVRLAERLLEIPGAEPVRRDMLAATLGYYRQFVADAKDDPKLRHELAIAHFKSGMIAAKLGAAAEAIAEYQTAQRILAQLAAAGTPLSPDPLSQLAIAHNNLGLLLAARGDVADARDQYASAIAIQERLLSRHAADPAIASQLAESQANLGMLLDQTGDGRQAERSLRAAVDVLRPLAESLAAEPKYARNLAIALNNLSFVLRKRNADAAGRASREAVAVLEPLTQQHPSRLDYQDDLALCANNLAAIESHENRLSEAIDWYKKAIALHERLVRKAPAVVRHRSDLAVSLNNLGVVYCRAERAAEADLAFARARDFLSTLAGDYPDELAYKSSLAALLNNQALALAGAGRNDDALAIYPVAIRSQRACWQERAGSPMMSELLSKMSYNYGQSLQTAGRLGEAIEVALARREVWRKNGERLLGVAVELSQIGGQSRGSDGSLAQDARRKLDEEVIATLREAHASGLAPDIDLATDERFTYLHTNKHFAAWIGQLHTRPAKSTATPSDVHDTASSTTN